MILEPQIHGFGLGFRAAGFVYNPKPKEIEARDTPKSKPETQNPMPA